MASIKNFTLETLTDYLIKRLQDIDRRERIVISMPFGHDINRIEVYCSETETTGGDLLGTKFQYQIVLQQFNDYTNKAISKTSYSYMDELFTFIPKLCKKLFDTLD
jgi:hypothetical protein